MWLSCVLISSDTIVLILYLTYSFLSFLQWILRKIIKLKIEPHWSLAQGKIKVILKVATLEFLGQITKMTLMIGYFYFKERTSTCIKLRAFEVSLQRALWSVIILIIHLQLREGPLYFHSICQSRLYMHQ